MSPKQYDAFMLRIEQSDVAHCCKHGHLDCSDRDGGDCCDEEFPLKYAEEQFRDAERAL